jgi:PAS domain S-box-containing protein
MRKKISRSRQAPRRYAPVDKDWLTASGEMAELIRMMDWSASSLGPRHGWPQSLCTAVNLVVAGSFPMAILWGSELILIYNDAYRIIAGGKHPEALGRSTRDIWSEVWEFNKPLFEKVMTRGETVHLENQLFRISRHGYAEDAYFTLSYSPIRIENGSIGGTLVTLMETTQAAQEALRLVESIREEKDRLASLINSIHDEVWFADTEGRFTLANPSAWHEFGFDANYYNIKVESFARSLEVYRPDGTPRAVEESPPLRALKGETVLNEEEIVRTPAAGELRYRQVSASPVKNAAGGIIGSVSVVRDITAHKRAENALQKLNAELEERIAERTSELVKTSQIIQAERQRLNEMLGHMPAYVILLSPDYHVPFANRFFEERFGKSNGKRCFEYLFGRTEPCDNCETFKALQTNAPHRWEWLGPDGCNYDIYDFPFIDTDGSRLIMEVGLDITERKKAAAEVQAERQQLFDVLETLPAMICLLTPDYQVVFSNRSFRKRFGESQGRHCYEYCFGKTAPCEFCESYRVLTSGQPHHWEVKSPDGSIIDAYDFPFTDVDGSPLILEMDTDITEQRRAEAVMRESSAYNRTLIEASMDPLVTIGPDGQITDVNTATEHVTGFKREELIGTDFSNYFTEPDKAQAGYQLVFREGAVRDYPLQIRHHDGHLIPVLYNATVYRHADGKIIGVFAAARDITDLKQAEEKLLQAHEDLAKRADQLRALTAELTLSEQRERSRLAKVLHDHLQQLLVAAKFRTTILARGGDDVTKQAAKEVEDLIDASIAASRSLTAELSPPILHESGLNAGLQWLSRRMAETHGLFVDIGLEESGPLPEAQKILLFESVRELLFNVVKHANVNKALVSLHRFDDSLNVIVSDQGHGFDPTSLSAAGETGKGFGLFAIRERLELMGGSIKIESNPGQGSRFVLSLPVASPEKIDQKPRFDIVLPEAKLIAPVHSGQDRKIRVMLVEDHAVVRQGIANLLANEPDIEVVGQAADGQEAIELAAKLLPHVILMDTSMPKLSGVEATRKICNDWPEIRVIGLSMFEDADRTQGMRDAGAVDYLTKSGAAEDLIKTIRKSVQTSGNARTVKTSVQ